jgi:hypothetical protein
MELLSSTRQLGRVFPNPGKALLISAVAAVSWMILAECTAAIPNTSI